MRRVDIVSIGHGSRRSYEGASGVTSVHSAVMNIEKVFSRLVREKLLVKKKEDER